MLEQTPRDHMTGFFVRDALLPLLRDSIRELSMYDKKFSVAIFDLDHFKRANDKYGHLFGDEILKDVASVLRRSIADNAYAFRYGGDEFVVVFLNKTPEEVYKLVRKCKKAVTDHIFTFQGKILKLAMSCGISEFPADGQTVDDLIKKADDAVYISKKFGGNLITKAGKIAYIHIRNTIMLLLVFLSILGSFFFMNNSRALSRVRSFFGRVGSKSANEKLDTIIMVDGSMIQAHVLGETGGKVRVRLSSRAGKAEFSLDKSSIADIIYYKR